MMNYDEMLTSAFKEATVGILVANKQGEIVVTNPYCNALFGYKSKEIIGQKIEFLIPKKFHSGHVGYRENYLKKPTPRVMGAQRELYGIKKNGKEFPVKISLSFSKLESETFAIAYITDDTHERNMLNQILSSKQQLNEAQRLAHIGSFEINLKTKIENWSPELYKIMDVDKNIQLIKYKQFFNKIHSDDLKRVKEFHKKIVKDKKGYNFEYRIDSEKGDVRYLNFKCDVSLNKKKEVEIIYGSIQDITELKKVETKLEDKINEIEQAEKKLIQLNTALENIVEERTSELAETINRLLETNTKLSDRENQLEIALSKERDLNELKSRFVSMASHEFRTPLSTVLSSASLISKYKLESQNDNRLKHISKIKSAVQNLTGILNDFLSLSKIEEGKAKPKFLKVSIDEVSKEIIDEVSVILKEGQEIKYSIEKPKQIVKTDERFLRNILINLLSNAIKYSPEKDKIIFKVNSNKSNLLIEIKDSGIGIPKAEQEHLFDRFFRASNVETIQGTGLGLSIVKRYVELLNGNITFKSIEGKGTSFFVKIPYSN